MKGPSKKLVVKSFEASKDMASCLTFAEGYVGILVGQGINNSYVGKLEWIYTPGVWGIMAETTSGEAVGGILLYVSEEGSTLPFEDIVGKEKMGFWFDKTFDRKEGGELFAVWNSKKTAGMGLSYVLLKAGVALATKLGLQRTYYLVSEYNLRLVQRIGLEVVKKDGIDVHFVFDHVQPISRNYLCVYENKENDPNQTINDLVEKGNLIRSENVLGVELEVDYRLFE